MHAITAEQANLSQYDGVEAINEDFEVVLRNGYEKDEGTADDKRFSDFVDTEAEEERGGVPLTEEERMEREYEHLEKVRVLEELGGDEWFRGEEATAKVMRYRICVLILLCTCAHIARRRGGCRVSWEG